MVCYFCTFSRKFFHFHFKRAESGRFSESLGIVEINIKSLLNAFKRSSLKRRNSKYRLDVRNDSGVKVEYDR